jgi:hypothetical protein
MSRSYTSSYPKRLHGVWRDHFTFTGNLCEQTLVFGFITKLNVFTANHFGGSTAGVRRGGHAPCLLYVLHTLTCTNSEFCSQSVFLGIV